MVNARLRAYLVFVYVLGVAAALLAFREPWPNRTLDAAVFVAVIYVSEWLAINLPREAHIGVAFAGYTGALLTFGPAVPVLGGILSALNPVDLAARKPAYRIAFNAAQFAVSVTSMHLVFSALGGTPVVRPGHPDALTVANALKACAGVPVFFAANTGLIALAVALSSGLSPVRVWSENYRWLVANYAALTLVGILMAGTYAAAGIPGVVLLVAPLLIARQTFSLYMHRREAYYQTVHSLVAAIEAKDPYTRGHSERVAEYAVSTAEHLGLDAATVERVRFAGLLHDLGKIAVDRKILSKPSRLTEEEYAVVKEHPELGAQILERITFLGESVPAIRAHHERPDGSGYSRGLEKGGIPLLARILAVADGFDAMTSARPYRAALTVEEAVGELYAHSGEQFDFDIVNAFIKATGLQEAAVGHQTTDEQLALDEAAT